MLILDAGTTWSKIIEKSSFFMRDFSEFLIKEENDCKYYILPSQNLKNINFKFDYATGHMSLNMLKSKNNYENEIIALIKGFQSQFKDKNALILDMGSRDSKWAGIKNGKFKDLDWNNSCSSSTGATIEMLLKFYNIDVKNLKFIKEKYIITCGIFGLEKIMDDIANGLEAEIAVSKFIHGIAYNAWCFAKKPQKIYLSGGFCQNECFVNSLKYYCDVIPLGRFILCNGLSLMENL